MRWPARVGVVMWITILCLSFGSTAAAGVSLEAWRFSSAPVFNQEVLDSLGEQFTARHPGVKVRVTEIPGNQDKLAERVQVAVAGGSPPDVVFMNRTQVLPLAKQGVLTPLPDRSISGLQTRFVPWAWNSLSYQGRQWGLPFTTDVRGLWWHKSLFEQSGLAGDVGPQTIDELEAYARKLTRWNGEGYIEQLGFAPWLGNWNVPGWLWAFGGSIYDPDTMRPTINTPANLAALNWIRSFAEQYPPSSWLPEVSQGQFLRGKVAMYPHISSYRNDVMAANPLAELGAGLVPHAPGGTNGTWSGGPGLVIPRGARNVDAVIEYMIFMTSEESQSFYYEKHGHLPTLIRSIQRAAAKADPLERTFLNQLPFSHARTPLWREVMVALGTGALVNGTISPAEFAARAQAQLEVSFAQVFGN